MKLAAVIAITAMVYVHVKYHVWRQQWSHQ